MKHATAARLGLAVTVTLGLAACSSGGGSDAATSADADAPVTLSLAGWSLSTTPEFQTLVDGFEAANPNVTIELTEYDATNYDTQMVADLAAGSAPDLITLKNLKNFYTYADGGQLLDVSDVAADIDSDAVPSIDSYTVDDVTYAVPYRQDSWYIYYNRDMFDSLGVDYPDGSWTWDDYADLAEELTQKLQAAGETDVTGTYLHNWQSIVQSFALAQTPGADAASDDLSYMASYYERVLELQDSGATPTFGTITTNKLTYQAQFGTQKAAMMPMGSWYVATLVAQQESGDADSFSWGFAPVPQYDESTTGTDSTPVTYGNPTGIAINAAIDDSKLTAATAFLAYVASEDASVALASIGITPALTSDAVTDAFFSTEGVPSDDLSQFAFTTHDTQAEWPASADAATVLNILNDANSSILSESVSVTDGLDAASARLDDEVLG
ncbi:MAG TPA: extracellular solute-binding protein [Cellulomonas sp.]